MPEGLKIKKYCRYSGKFFLFLDILEFWIFKRNIPAVTVSMHPSAASAGFLCIKKTEKSDT